MFTQAGQFKGRITEAKFAPSRFNKNDPESLDLALHIQTLDGVSDDWWNGELSRRTNERGPYAGQERWQETMGNLQKALNWEHAHNFNEQTIATLVGREIDFSVLASNPADNGKVFYNIKYIGAAPTRAPEDMAGADAQARLSGLFGAPGGQPPVAQNPMGGQPMQQPMGQPMQQQPATTQQAFGQQPVQQQPVQQQPMQPMQQQPVGQVHAGAVPTNAQPVQGAVVGGPF